MSYDLMVFNPKTAPKSEPEFLEWYGKQTEWTEDHSYDDPKVSSTELRNWFIDMITEFPALNGPYSTTESEELIGNETDYSVGIDVIYSSFQWPAADKAYSKMLEIARKHKVGFYDASGDGNIMFPSENGILESINKKTESKPWWKFW